MAIITGVRFKPVGKIYYFDPRNFDIKNGDNVIVETVRGVEFGTVVIAPREISDDEISKPLKPIMRLATPGDIKQQEKNRQREAEARKICQQKIHEHRLEMNLVDVEFTFDGNKVLFYFTADGRVDFRELVKDLATVFKTRIELRQIGVRDESKLMGSIGICGRSICCSSFLGEFVPVSIKMAKEQGLSLNPGKISGACGRLMCCLKYEQDVYSELLKVTPHRGDIVSTPGGNGTVEYVSMLKGTVKVKPESGGDTLMEYNVRDIKIIKSCGIKNDFEKIDEEILKTLEE